MTRTVIAVVAGFAVWSVLWFAANAALGAAGLLSPPGEALNVPSVLFLLLAASVLASLAAGYSASRLARAPGHKPALWLGVALLLTGLFVQIQYWNLMPLWYHVPFLALLLPVCLAGSRLSARGSSRPMPPRGAV